ASNQILLEPENADHCSAQAVERCCDSTEQSCHMHPCEPAWQVVCSAAAARVIEPRLPGRVDADALPHERAFLVPRVKRFHEVELRLDEVRFECSDAPVQMVADYDPAELTRVWRPPSNAAFILIEVAGDCTFEPTNVRDLHADGLGEVLVCGSTVVGVLRLEPVVVLSSH